MRLWLGFAFAVVGAITAVTVYQFVHDSNERVISERSTELLRDAGFASVRGLERAGPAPIAFVIGHSLFVYDQ